MAVAVQHSPKDALEMSPCMADLRGSNHSTEIDMLFMYCGSNTLTPSKAGHLEASASVAVAGSAIAVTAVAFAITFAIACGLVRGNC